MFFMFHKTETKLKLNVIKYASLNQFQLVVNDDVISLHHIVFVGEIGEEVLE